jgi:ribosome recycling factor
VISINTDISPKSFELAIKPEMEKAIDHLLKELAKIRTGRAHTSMVEDLLIDVYGSNMRVKELGLISAPEADLIVIQPWDKSVIKDLERGLAASELGVTPANDGNIIRIQLPQISHARREELCKLLGKKLEDCRTSVRNIRKEFQNSVRTAEKNKIVSEDVAKKLLTTLQNSTDSYIAKAEELAAKKETEIKPS